MKCIQLLLIAGAVALALSAVAAPQPYSDIAAKMQAVMNPSADPCNDFYNYACGNYANVYAGNDSQDAFQISTVKIVNNLGNVLPNYDPATATKTPQFPYNQAGIAFDKCMYGLSMNSTADLTMMLQYMNSVGGWPSVQDVPANVPSGGAAGLAGYLVGNIAVSVYFGVGVTTNIESPKMMNLMLGTGPESILINSTYPNGVNNPPTLAEMEALYIGYAKAVAAVSRVTINTTQLQTDARLVGQIIVDSYTATWNASGGLVSLDNMQQYANYEMSLLNNFTVSQALQRFPNFDMVSFLTNLATGNAPLDQMFRYPMYIAYPSYFDWMNTIFGKYDDRTLRNWAMFWFAEDASSFLPSLRELYRKSPKFEKKYGKMAEVPTQAGLCANELTGMMPMLIGRVYADISGLTQKDLDNLSEMIGVMLSSWRGMLATVDWMTDYSRQNAYAKIVEVIRNVAWPAWLMNDAALANYFAPLNLSMSDDAFTIYAKVNKVYTYQAFSQVGLPYDRSQFIMSPAEVNAAYDDQFNSINFPAAIMINPFFNSSYPLAYNYAKIGWVMGHELGHAFDNNGIYWGPYGELHPTTWADNSTQAGFNNMAQCVVAEYNKFCDHFPIPDTNMNYTICVNGNQTLPENIADNGGLYAAYRSYSAMTALMGGDYPIPAGFGPLSTATPDQFFFIAATQTWCSNIPEYEQVQLIYEDVHSPDKFRPQGALRNIPEFGKAFNCKAGDAYYPTTPCKVWRS